MATAINPSTSPPTPAKSHRSHRKAVAKRPTSSVQTSRKTRPIRRPIFTQRVAVVIPRSQFTRNPSLHRQSCSDTLSKKVSQCVEVSKKKMQSNVPTVRSKLVGSRPADRSPCSRIDQSASPKHTKIRKLRELSWAGAVATADKSEDLDPSRLDEIEEKITSTSIIFSDASVPCLNSKHDDPTGAEFMIRVDERCFEVLKNSELDDRSDHSDHQLVPSDVDLDEMHDQLSSPFQSPKRLSSVSPLKTSVKTSNAHRKSARKVADSLAHDPKEALALDSRSTRNLKANNEIVGQGDSDVDQEEDFPPKIVLPLLHGLLSHLSGIKPLPIQIPSDLLTDHLSDVTHSENNLSRIQSILDLTPCLVGLEDLELELRSLLFRSISQHEGNVLLLSGARGSGKTALVSRSLSLLSDTHTFGPSGFITIKLNGLVHNNDKVALKEMCRQLFFSLRSSDATEDSTDDRRKRRKLEKFNQDLDLDDDLDYDLDSESAEQHDGPGSQNLSQHQPKFSNYGETLKNLLDVLEPTSSKFTATTEEDNGLKSDLYNNQSCKALVIVLEDFDMFSDLDRQSFLYCLLDSVQGNKRQNGICVIGTTSVVDCLDRLEKRVKSRCQSRIRYIDPPTDESERKELIQSLLEFPHSSIMPESSPSDKNQLEGFIVKWNDELAKFLDHRQVLDWLKSKFELISNPMVQVLQDLHTMISMIAHEIKRTGKTRSPMLKPIELFRNTGINSNNSLKSKGPERRIVRSSTMMFSSLPWWANEMGNLEFSVLIACKHLSSIHHNGIFNLEMAWDLYRQHLKRHALGADVDPLSEHRDHHLRVTNVRSQIYGRDAFELAWERLKRLEIIIPISILNSRIYTTTPATSTTTSKNKKHLNKSAAAAGKGYELVKFVPFLTQVDLVISHLSTNLLANHLVKWSKNSTD